MIDNFALGVSHGLLLLCAWRLIFRADIDDDSVKPPVPGARSARWGVQPNSEESEVA